MWLPRLGRHCSGSENRAREGRTLKPCTHYLSTSVECDEPLGELAHCIQGQVEVALSSIGDH